MVKFTSKQKKRKDDVKVVTKEHNARKTCCFCASDYHLEMVILPYIKERLETSKFVIMTEKDLDKSVKTLLERTNLEEKSRDKIINIDWKANDFEKFKEIKDYSENNEKLAIFVNGDSNYINNINRNIEKWVNGNVSVIDCFHIEEVGGDINNISKRYNNILNTGKIN